MKLTIKNETRYRTSDLRAIFRAGMRAMHVQGDKVVRVVYSKRSMHWGCAYLGRWRDVPNGQVAWQDGRMVELSMKKLVEAKGVTMTLPPADRLNLREFCRVWMHELSHTLGARHGDMPIALRECREDLDTSWAEGLELREGAEATLLDAGAVLAMDPQVQAELREERRRALVDRREAHAREKLEEWQERARRAGALVKKYKAKVRGYEQRAAARQKARKV